MSLKRNTNWNLAGFGLPLLLGLVAIPYLIKQVGVEAFGVLTLVWALIGYFSLFDFGLGRALTQQVATNRVSGQIHQLPSLIKTGLFFTAATGLIGGILLAVLAEPLGFKWLRVGIPLQLSTFYALLIASFGIPMTTLTTGLRGILEAYEDFKAVNLLRMVLGSANFGLPVVIVMVFGPALALMVGSLIVARLVVLVAHFYLVYKKLPAGWLNAKFSKHNMRSLLSFGAWMTVSNIISPLMVTADRFIISTVLGASVVAYYTVPFEVVSKISIIPGALSAALFPRIASMLVIETLGAKHLYYQSIKIVAAAMLPICALTAIGSHWGLSIWLGKEFADHSWSIVSILAVGIFVNGMAAVPYSIIQAAGNARLTARLHILEVVLYLPLLIICLNYFGLVGAAIVWTGRVGFDFIVLVFCANKIIGVKSSRTAVR